MCRSKRADCPRAAGCFPFNTSVSEEFRQVAVIDLDIPAPEDLAGGIIVADVNDDRKSDISVTMSGHLAVYDNSGANR
jgi:hypothetical protein